MRRIKTFVRKGESDESFIDKQETFQKEYAGASKLFDAFGRMEKAIEQLKRLESGKKENTELRETVK